jgi:hypothetical protein
MRLPTVHLAYPGWIRGTGHALRCHCCTVTKFSVGEGGWGAVNIGLDGIFFGKLTKEGGIVFNAVVHINI